MKYNIRYKFKIGQVVKIKNLKCTEHHTYCDMTYNNKIGYIVEREHPESILRSNEYKIVICGKPEHPVWFLETDMEKFE
jgi:hypothetical protein